MIQFRYRLDVSTDIETLEKATERGSITKTDGTFFAFRGVVRRFVFTIADQTPSLVKVLKKHDLKNDWNPEIFVRYGVFITIITITHTGPV